MNDELKAAYERIHARELLARDQLIATYPTLTEAAVAALNRANGSPDVVRGWRDERRIFGVGYHGEIRHPAFQFENGVPKSVIAVVLKHLDPLDPTAQCNPDMEPAYSSWAIAFWFASANGWLEGRAPAELIDIDPVAVVTAASHARDKISD
jgi:hypothetical protein